MELTPKYNIAKSDIYYYKASGEFITHQSSTDKVSDELGGVVTFSGPDTIYVNQGNISRTYTRMIDAKSRIMDSIRPSKLTFHFVKGKGFVFAPTATP